MIVAAEGDRRILFTRDFAAPRPLVWRAMTEPALILRWLFVAEYPMTRCDQDFREGGWLRWEWSMPGNRVMGVSGTYRKIDAPGLIVHTENFDEDWTGGETLVTLRLIEAGPTLTRMHQTVEYSGSAARDAALLTPMAEGMDEGYNRLDGLWPNLGND
jgi:uncharacterized protein YndB with AHSA1/START domain